MPTVLITGASSGIGKACVDRFAAHGWNVAATMRRPERAREFAWPEEVRAIRLDLDDPASVTSARDETAAAFGSVDVLVNNAGYGLTGAIETCSEAQIRAQFETNLFGTLHVIQTFLPDMRERDRGCIVNVSSIGGRIGFPFYGYYNATKWSLEAISESLWHELARTRVRVRIVEPGFTQTAFAKQGLVTGELDVPFYRQPLAQLTERLKNSGSGTPPSELAALIHRAATDRSRRLRYQGGRYARLLLALRRILPERAFLGLIQRSIET